jgi:predicted ATPase
LDIADRSIERARELKHANTLCYAALHDVILSIWAENISRTKAVTEEMRSVANEHDMSLWKIYADIHDAVAACMADEPEAPARLDAALSVYKANGCWLWITLFLSEQAKALLRAGDRKGAEKSVLRALAEQETTGERWAESELHRILGEIKLLEDDKEAAKQAFETAISIARKQKARALEDRAIASLNRLQAS